MSDGIVRYGFDKSPPKTVRLAVCDWLISHGIAPSDVALPGWIEVREAARQIAYEAFVRDSEGEILWKPGIGAERETQVLQLEGRPLPFPISLTSFIPPQ